MDLEQHDAGGRPGAPDVVVVGGGVIGMSVAWKVASTGARVALVDPEPGRGATWAAAGMLAPVTELKYGETALLRLNQAGADLFESFASELEELSGTTIGYRRCGTLSVAADSGDRSVLLELRRFHESLDLESYLLSSRECRELEPSLAPGVRAGLLAPGDHQVDNRRLASALLEALARLEVAVVRQAVSRIGVDRGRVRGAQMRDGSSLACGALVVAAGCWSHLLEGVPTGSLPRVRPVKGQILRLRGPASPALLSRTVHGVVKGSSVYLVPRADGGIVLGATVEEMGYDTTVTAEAVHALLHDGMEIAPGLRELELVEAMAGLRPGSPDNAPLIGPTGLEGLLLASGHYRNGLLLAPVTAQAITSVLTGGEVPGIVKPFSPLRFIEGGGDGLGRPRVRETLPL